MHQRVRGLNSQLDQWLTCIEVALVGGSCIVAAIIVVVDIVVAQVAGPCKPSAHVRNLHWLECTKAWTNQAKILQFLFPILLFSAHRT